METMRTPDGEYKPIFQALNEWYALFEPMESLGFVVHAYDPGVSFHSKECKGNLSTFCISVSDLKIINEAIKR
jgi:hypothetical protein